MMPPPAVKTSGVVIPEKPSGSQRFLAWVVFVLLRILFATVRYRWIDRCGLAEKQRRGATIYCIWHNRLALSMASYFRYISPHNPTKGLAVMVSASRDGGRLTAVLERFGVQPARGSTSRRGRQALRELTNWGRRGYDLAITPDGPRGPHYVVQDGVIALAQLTGMEVVAVSFNPRWKISLKSWDRFQIPLPFTRCDMIFESAIIVPREATETDRETLRLRLEQNLNGITRD